MSENYFDTKMKRTTDLELRCNYEKRREGILEVVFGHINQKEKNYQLPDNLKRFFSGKDQQNVKKGCC
ncbi:hypothetical protein EUCA11A_34870 [Eubacterium callanderi]|uniref:hypothetical protein n=1 Tax=Eubacterium callanderi TaxID=53442 RepID=UPI0029FF077C|nr:hypothetical protein [Eubacterium callanderi]WPK69299.1 hypothetical protein EUCA2A_34870 [Eubacterium callanderi]WPK73597.1 hypothetical protein EUCA11A_34870 [Eubacterium callanderi]